MKYTKSKHRSWLAALTAAALALVFGVTLIGFQPIPNAFASTTSKTTSSSQSSHEDLSGNLTLSSVKGNVGSILSFDMAGLNPNQPVKMMWDTETGSYKLKGIYTFDRPVYKHTQQTLLTGTSDANGKWLNFDGQQLGIDVRQ